MQVLVFQIERHAQTFALDGREQGRVDIQIDRIAELVELRGLRRLNAGGKVLRVVPPDGTLAETPQKISQRLVAQKIQPLLRQPEMDVARQRLTDFARPALPLLPRLSRLFLTQF